MHTAAKAAMAPTEECWRAAVNMVQPGDACSSARPTDTAMGPFTLRLNSSNGWWIMHPNVRFWAASVKRA